MYVNITIKFLLSNHISLRFYILWQRSQFSFTVKASFSLWQAPQDFAASISAIVTPRLFFAEGR